MKINSIGAKFVHEIHVSDWESNAIMIGEALERFFGYDIYVYPRLDAELDCFEYVLFTDDCVEDGDSYKMEWFAIGAERFII